MKKLVTAFVLLAILIVAYLFISALGFSADNEGQTLSESKAEVVNYFSQELQNKFITEVAQPIEGFWPEMFMQVWPGLVAQDFDGVEALLGVYKVEGDQIAFVIEEGAIVHSAAEAVSPQGMYTLLVNVSERLSMPIETKEDIDALLTALSGGEAGQVQNQTTATAKLNEKVMALGVSITPLEVLEDSRCPQGATCIWEGRVRLSAQIESGLGASTMEMEVGKPITTEAEEITLIDILPDAVLDVEIQDKDYSFTFLIKKR